MHGRLAAPPMDRRTKVHPTAAPHTGGSVESSSIQSTSGDVPSHLSAVASPWRRMDLLDRRRAVTKVAGTLDLVTHEPPVRTRLRPRQHEGRMSQPVSPPLPPPPAGRSLLFWICRRCMFWRLRHPGLLLFVHPWQSTVAVRTCPFAFPERQRAAFSRGSAAVRLAPCRSMALATRRSFIKMQRSGTVTSPTVIMSRGEPLTNPHLLIIMYSISLVV